MTTYVGSSLKRFEDPQLVQGKGVFVDDMVLPGMLHAAVLRSPHAHARIVSVDVSQARSMPGVVAVLTPADIEGVLGDIPPRGTERLEDAKFPHHPVLARGKVCYVGQPVAVVVAESRYLARDALDLLRVEYQPLAPLMDPLEAAGPESPLIHEEMGTNVAMRVQVGRGDVEAAFAQADRTVRERYHVPRLSAAPMEGRGLIAHYQASERHLTLWTSSQVPHKVKSFLAPLLKRPDISLRIVAPDVGGGFGQKVEIWPEEVALCHLSIRLERPIKWIEERWENVLAYQARGYYADVEAAVKSDGAILGMRFRMVADFGAYSLTSSPGPPYNTARRVAGPYAIPNMDNEILGVITNKPPTGPYRGAGGPEGAFFMERTVDLIARELNLDPAEVRRRNFVPPDAFPYANATGQTYDSGQFAVAFDRALELGEYSRFRQMQRESLPGQPLIGVGVATVVKQAGGIGEMRDSTAVVRIEPTGEVKVHTEISPHGQGTETTFAQIAADELGIRPDHIRILHGDSDLPTEGLGTFASRGLTVGGSAMYLGLQEARRKMAQIAGHILECPAEDIDFRDEKAFNRRDPEQVMSFQELASAAYRSDHLPDGVEPGLEFYGTFTLPNNAYGFGAHVAVIQVDPDTGDIGFLRYAAVHDCGRIINPKLTEGQIDGAMAQGLGQALMEAMLYSPEGQPLTGTFMDYSMPTAEDMPKLETDMLQTPSPVNPLGVKGGGELPTVASPVAVANALADALSRTTFRHLDAPLTPEKVWRALREKAP